MKTLVLCIDRDDDIGRKTSIKGPILGIEENIKAAVELALVDPEDTDSNAIFGAVKVAKKLNTEIATLTGDIDIGLTSDKKIADQLDKLIAEFKPESVVLVTDGAADEQLIPIVQSRIKIDSVQTIIVRQSKELEKAYFQITNFIREVSRDPNLARFIFAIPGIALLLLAIAGLRAFNWILAVIGIYLIIKGLGLEEGIFRRISEFLKTLSFERISTMTYFIAFVTLVVGLAYAYSDLGSINFRNVTSFFDTFSIFFLNSTSIDVITLAILIAIIGKIIDVYGEERYLRVRRYLILLGFVILIRIVLDTGSHFWTSEETALGEFILKITAGILGFYLWIKITTSILSSEIQTVQKIINDTIGKEVYTKDGKLIGKVSKVLLDKHELDEIRIGRRKINKKDIVSIDKVITITCE